MAVPEALIVVTDTKSAVSVGDSLFELAVRSIVDVRNPELTKVLRDQYIALCRDQTLVISAVAAHVTPLTTAAENRSVEASIFLDLLHANN